MFAVVLVGGFGTGFAHDKYRAETDAANRQHAMVVRLAERLAAGGVTDIVLALGFQPDAFRAAFPGDSLTYDGPPSTCTTPLSPSHEIQAKQSKFAADSAGVDDTFVVANGDIVTALPIADLVRFHHALGREATIHLTPVDDPLIIRCC